MTNSVEGTRERKEAFIPPKNLPRKIKHEGAVCCDQDPCSCLPALSIQSAIDMIWWEFRI